MVRRTLPRLVLAFALVVASPPAKALTCSGACSGFNIPSTVPEPGDPNQRPKWIHTGIAVQAGDTLCITATGFVNDGGGFAAGPNGTSFHGDPQSQFPDWYQGVAHLCLVGRLRLASNPATVVALDDGIDPNGISGPGFVGSSFSMVAPAAGTIELAVNDGDTGNNSGSFNAIVCVGPRTPGSCITPPAGMTGWWPGDGNALDIRGGRTAIFHGNATTGAGLVAGAFALDGDGDWMEVPGDAGLNIGTANFSVDLWARFNTTAGEQVLIEKWVQTGSSSGSGWTFTKTGSQELVFAVASPSLLDDVRSAPLFIPTGTWLHFAARRNAGLCAIFVNGQLLASKSMPQALGSPSSLKFGHRGNPTDTPGSTDTRQFYLNGGMDEVELFVGRALSDTEILALYSAGADGKCKTGPVGVESGDESGRMISAVFPNPTRTGASLQLQFASPAVLRAGIYDFTGREVRRFADKRLPGGREVLRWDGRDAAGRKVPAGLYFWRGTLGSAGFTRSSVVLR